MNRVVSALAVCLLSTALITLEQKSAAADEVSDLKAEIAKLKETIEALKSRLAIVESERDSLQVRVNRIENDTAKAESDLFAVGMKWEGSRFMTGPKSSPRDNGQKWSLVITERNGERFKGHIQYTSRDDRDQKVEVSGNAPTKATGRVIFKTVVVGVLQQSFEGVLKGNQISLTWEGAGVAGRKIGGTANLSR